MSPTLRKAADPEQDHRWVTHGNPTWLSMLVLNTPRVTSTVHCEKVQLQRYTVGTTTRELLTRRW